MSYYVIQYQNTFKRAENDNNCMEYPPNLVMK